MKRLRYLLFFLFLGLIINIAVAWACSYWSYIEPPGMLMAWESIPELDTGEGWTMHRKQAFGATQVLALSGFKGSETDDPADIYPYWSSLPDKMKHAADRARQEREDADLQSRGRMSILTVLMQKGYGWPFRSMHWDWSQSYGRSPTSALQWGYPLSHWVVPGGSSSLDEKRAIPLGVLPLGFLANTLLYAALLWAIHPGLSRLRRHLRKGKGLCPMCAYDLRGTDHDACPECGQRLASGEPA